MHCHRLSIHRFINENIVNFYNPGNHSQRGGSVPLAAAKYAIMINDSIPGPSVWSTVGDVVNITVNNELMSDSVAVHWHGIHQWSSPWSDGAEWISQCPLEAGGVSSYVFTVDVPGTYFYHSHVGLQMDLGLVGPLIVVDPADPHRNLYDTDAHPLLLQDWWWDPVSMLKAPKFLDFNNLEVAVLNGGGMATSAGSLGQWGNPSAWGNGTNTSLPESTAGVPTPMGVNGGASVGGSSHAPPVVELQGGMCHRLRWINANGEFMGWQVSVGGHNMTIIALDAANLAPRSARSFSFYGGNRVDTVVCLDAAPGEYPILMQSVDQLSPVCPWWPDHCQYDVIALIRYTAANASTPAASNSSATVSSSTVDRSLFVGLPYSDHADMMRAPAEYIPLVPVPAPPPTKSIRIKVGFLAETGPSGTKAFGYSVKQPFILPTYPSLFASGGCGQANHTFTETIDDENEVVEVIIDNLTDIPHPMHLHGNHFSVLATHFYVESQWEGDFGNQTLCPQSLAEHGDLRWSTTPAAYRRFWGCTFSNSSADRARYLNTATPYRSDTVVVPPRGWAVIRITDWHSGAWLFHCHINHHAVRGMQFLFDALPHSRPEVPPWVDVRCGPCPFTFAASPASPPTAALSGLALRITVAAAVIVGCLLISLALLASYHRNRMHLYKALSTATSNQGKVASHTEPSMTSGQGQNAGSHNGPLSGPGSSWKSKVVHSESSPLMRALQTPVGVMKSEGPLAAGAWSGGDSDTALAVGLSEGSGSRLLTHHQGDMSESGLMETPAHGSTAAKAAAASLGGPER
ncbi:MAG: hypothetical protein WDW38_002557 [Sanguina aurantia]